MKLTFVACSLLWLACVVSGRAAPASATPAETNGWTYTEMRRYRAAEAGQGVAVDREFFYAINNHTIAKYRKEDGARVALWDGGAGGEIIHLNSGSIVESKLYAVHSNYPAVPMLSSVEIFDPATLTHIGSHSFGRMDGSFTWLERRDQRWIACFVHYGKRGAEPSRDPAWTQILAFDDAWRRTGGWALPAALLARIGDRGYSASGGAFGPGGHLYLTGHDNPELYVLAFPRAGSVLTWLATIPVPVEGQAFSWDPADPSLLYTIARKTREVVVGRVTVPAPPASK